VKLKVEVTKTEKVWEEIEVDFPLYLTSGDVFEYASYETEHRIDEDGRMISITLRSGNHHGQGKYEIEVDKITIATDLSQYVSSTYHYRRSTAADFKARKAAFDAATAGAF
jgi:hypothetical protein